MTIVAFNRLRLPALEPASEELTVEEAHVRAKLHAAWEAEVTFSLPGSAPSPPDMDSLIGSEAELSLGGVMHRGLVTAVALHGIAAVTVTIAPAIAQLAQTCDHRVFVDRAPLDVIDEVLADHGLRMDRRVDAPPAPKMQCVQAFESDLAFLGRLLATEGIAWCAEPTSDAVLAVDHPSGYAPIDGEDRLPYGAGDGLDQAEAVIAARLRHRVRPDVATLRDSWFETPALDLTADDKRGPGSIEHYAFVGPNRYTDPAAGKAIASRWLDALTTDGVVLEGTSTCPRLWPGRSFELTEPPRKDLARRWLVVAMASESHERTEGKTRRYEARFVAVPADRGWRPPLPEPAQLGGVMTATITGPAGEEIHCDDYGRVRAKLRWDRRGPDDDKSSSPIRPLHPPTSGGFMLPRVGWEALMGFGGPSGDMPFVLGRLDNGGAPTAESLPGDKRRGNFGTPTSPGGGSANMLRMDDTAGNEEMRVAASADYDEQTTKNKAVTIKTDDDREVAGNQDIKVIQNHGVVVQSPQSIAVAAKRDLTSVGGIAISASSQDITVGGVRNVTVGGHLSNKVGGDLGRAVGGAKIGVPILGHNRHVDGVSVRVIGGAHIAYGTSDAVSVGGASMLTCGTTSVTAGSKFTLQSTALTETGGPRMETVGGAVLVDSPLISLSCGALTFDAGETHIFARASVTINAGGAVLKLEPGKVTLSGALNVSGQIHPTGDVKHG
jgi:type VI secretion system secreted protein VgrG